MTKQREQNTTKQRQKLRRKNERKNPSTLTQNNQNQQHQKMTKNDKNNDKTTTTNAMTKPMTKQRQQSFIPNIAYYSLIVQIIYFIFISGKSKLS